MYIFNCLFILTVVKNAVLHFFFPLRGHRLFSFSLLSFTSVFCFSP